MTDSLSPAQLDTVVRTVLGEAEDQGPAGMAAVASVIRNRANSGAFGTTDPAAIARQPRQFSAWNSGHGGNRIPRTANPSSPTYQTALQAVEGIFGGTTPDPTGGATYYYAPRGMPGGSAPDWAGSMTPTVTIGAHHFFADPNHPVPPADIPDAAPAPISASGLGSLFDSRTASMLAPQDGVVTLPMMHAAQGMFAPQASTTGFGDPSASYRDAYQAPRAVAFGDPAASYRDVSIDPFSDMTPGASGNNPMASQAPMGRATLPILSASAASTSSGSSGAHSANTVYVSPDGSERQSSLAGSSQMPPNYRPRVSASLPVMTASVPTTEVNPAYTAWEQQYGDPAASYRDAYQASAAYGDPAAGYRDAYQAAAAKPIPPAPPRTITVQRIVPVAAQSAPAPQAPPLMASTSGPAWITPAAGMTAQQTHDALMAQQNQSPTVNYNGGAQTTTKSGTPLQNIPAAQRWAAAAM